MAKRIKYIRLFLLLTILIGIGSCLPEPLEVNGVPNSEATVVIGSQNLPEDFLVISLSKNFAALQGGPDTDIDSLIQDLLIDSVAMQITVEGQSYTLDNPSPGLYLSTELPKITRALYTLEFENPINKKPISAITELLPFVGFTSLSTSLEITPFDTLINIDMQINDPIGPNWYMINVQKLKQEFDIQDTPFTELLKDPEFDGSLYNYGFRVFFRDYAPGDTVLISMANISKEYYDFLELQIDQRYSFLEAVGEPATYPTNIENGLGFFHAHTPDVRLILAE